MGGCQSGRKVIPHDSKSDLPLAESQRSFAAQFSSAVKVNPTNAFFVQVSCFKVLLVRGGGH